MSASDQLKEAYVQLEAGHRYYDEIMITHLLHKYNPRFLELDARWVDALIEAEGDMKDEDGLCNLMFLFMSDKLDDFDFGCRRFQELLQKQRDWVNNYNMTVLMNLCQFNSQLLNHDWAVELVQ